MKPFKPGAAEAGGLAKGVGGFNLDGSTPADRIAIGSVRSARLGELLPVASDPALLKSRG